jgi:dihydroflavonol-4-reductase
MRTVLVTGATGFVGEFLCHKLSQLGYLIRILTRKSSDLSGISQLHPQIVQGDVTDANAVDQAVKGVDAVFHLAGVIGYLKSERDVMEKVNVLGTEIVARACLNANARLVLVSSMAAVGANKNSSDKLLDENSSFEYFLKLDLGYYVTKWKAEQVVLKMHKEEGLDVLIVNPTNIYGEGDAKKSSRGTQVKVALGRFPFYTNGGVNVVHVDDVVSGMILALDKGKAGQRYIIGGENLTLYQLFKHIAEEGGNKTPWICLPHFLNLFLGLIGVVPYEKICVADMYFWYSSEKAVNELGYSSKPAQVALSDSVKWMRKNFPVEKQKYFDKRSNPSLKFALKTLGGISALFLLILYFKSRKL